MKIGKPIPRSEIPESSSSSISRHEALYQQVLNLNGEALPIEFETLDLAHRAAAKWTVKVSRCRQLGIRVSKRGNTVYLFKVEADSA